MANGIKLVFDFLFCRWGKWELYKEDITYTKVTYSPPGYGFYPISKEAVLCDIYRSINKFSGVAKYKRVIKHSV